MKGMRFVLTVLTLIGFFGLIFHSVEQLREANDILEIGVTGTYVRALEEASRESVSPTDSTTNSFQTESTVESASRFPLPEGRQIWGTWYGEAPWECLGCNPDLIMANGERFDETAWTAAANWLPLGTEVVVTWGGKSVIVTITDRMLSDYKIDLSKSAFAELGSLDIGSMLVTVEEL